jgi:hypothetical protein
MAGASNVSHVQVQVMQRVASTAGTAAVDFKSCTSRKGSCVVSVASMNVSIARGSCRYICYWCGVRLATGTHHELLPVSSRHPLGVTVHEPCGEHFWAWLTANCAVRVLLHKPHSDNASAADVLMVARPERTELQRLRTNSAALFHCEQLTPELCTPRGAARVRLQRCTKLRAMLAPAREKWHKSHLRWHTRLNSVLAHAWCCHLLSSQARCPRARSCVQKGSYAFHSEWCTACHSHLHLTHLACGAAGSSRGSTMRICCATSGKPAFSTDRSLSRSCVVSRPTLPALSRASQLPLGFKRFCTFGEVTQRITSVISL